MASPRAMHAYRLDDRATVELHVGAVPDAPSVAELRRSIPFERRSVLVFGRWRYQPREVCLMGDEAVTYSYSGASYSAVAWSEPVLRMKRRVESLTGDAYNCCLLNLYNNGKQYVSWHSDDEPGIDRSSIASVSVGATRDFQIRSKRDKADRINFELADGDLFVMRDAQDGWQHTVPIRAKVKDKRISLTFRKAVISSP